MPRCWVSPIAVSGASVKLPTLKPSMSDFVESGGLQRAGQRLRDEPVRIADGVPDVGTVTGATSATSSSPASRAE